MKAGIAVFFLTFLTAGSALAQGGPTGRGAVTGDPAASSATPHASSQTTGSAPRSNPSSNPSGSGTSTSGGKDANGDAGRDKMPNSDPTVRPMDQQHHPEDK
jgi:hypothetical protein